MFMVEFALQHPIATVFAIWVISETITVAIRDICAVFEKKTN